MKKFTLFSLAAAFSLGLFAANAQEQELSIGTEGGYPPFSMADAAGNVTGFDADVGELLCEKLEMKCRFVVQAFDGLIPALKAKRFDIIISAMSITEERLKEIDYSIPYAEPINLFMAPKTSDLANMNDLDTLFAALKGKTVGVQAGTTHAQYVAKRIPEAVLRTYDTLDQMQIDLAVGRLDAAFSEFGDVHDFLSKPDGQNFKAIDIEIRNSSDPTLGVGLGVGIAKENTELKARINQALCELLGDGSIGRASVKWIEIDMSMPCEM